MDCDIPLNEAGNAIDIITKRGTEFTLKEICSGELVELLNPPKPEGIIKGISNQCEGKMAVITAGNTQVCINGEMTKECTNEGEEYIIKDEVKAVCAEGKWAPPA